MLRWRHSGRKRVDLCVCLGDSRDVGEVDICIHTLDHHTSLRLVLVNDG